MGTAVLRSASRAPLGILDDVTTSPASRRLASARPALAPKCQLILAQTLRYRAKIRSPSNTDDGGAAINDDRLACHPARGSGREKNRGSGNVLRLSNPAQGISRFCTRQNLGILPECSGEICSDESGRNAVDSHVFRSPL